MVSALCWQLCCWACVSESAQPIPQLHRLPQAFTGSAEELPQDICSASGPMPDVCRPPELLVEGMMSKAGDVFAFGVLLW